MFVVMMLCAGSLLGMRWQRDPIEYVGLNMSLRHERVYDRLENISLRREAAIIW